MRPVSSAVEKEYADQVKLQGVAHGVTVQVNATHAHRVMDSIC